MISDLRYKSEAELLRKAFKHVLITTRIERFKTSPSDDPSERDLDDYKFDVRLNNKDLPMEKYLSLLDMVLA